MWLFLVAAVAMAAPAELDIELTKPSIYLGKGPVETGFEGIAETAQVYHFEVRAEYDLREHVAGLDPLVAQEKAMSWFDTVARDYEYYPYVSPLVREAFGKRVDPGDPTYTALDFVRDLAAAENENGARPLLSDRRVHQLALELVDGFPLRRAAFAHCPAEVKAWLWKVVDAPPGTTEELSSAVRAMSGPNLRARIAATPAFGCERKIPRDYLFMSFGVPSGAPGGWFIVELDFANTSDKSKSLPAHKRYLPSIEVAGPIHYFDGKYEMTWQPEKGALEIIYGYRMDLSRWPERIVTRYHERVIIDFMHAMHERFVELRESGQLK